MCRYRVMVAVWSKAADFFSSEFLSLDTDER
jgi:hypothetical protein